MKCEFWANVNKANVTVTALVVHQLILGTHATLVNPNEWPKKDTHGLTGPSF